MAAQIKHLVVLMLENRSFDHMLGFLKSDEYAINGLAGGEMNRDSTGEPIRVSKDAQDSGDLATDPSHDFEDVMEQMFGTRRLPTPGERPDMSGFVINYEKFTRDRVRSANIMKCFDAAGVAVLAKLAQEYAVCDRWFSSVPGPTLPNRLYVHAGTSRGRLDLSPDFLGGFHTVYEILARHNVSSTIFYHDWSAALSFEGLLLHHQAQFFAEYNRFGELVRNNRLPQYSFIEPRYNSQSSPSFLPANDQHPDHGIASGEMLLRRVYEDLRSNDDVWKSSVMAVMYDEHGGIYDHEPPERCESPDGIVCASPPFDFRLLGPRVPAVIISPYIQPRTIDSTLYDHTSVIATAMKLFAPQLWPSDVLGRRAQMANTFDKLLDLSASPRVDTPDFTNLQPAPEFATAPPIHPAAKSLSVLQQEAVDHARILEQRLPAELKTNINSSTIRDEHAAGEYLSRVATQLQRFAQGVRDAHT